MGFRLPFERLLQQTGSEAIAEVRQANRKKIKNLLLLDLVLEEGTPTSVWHGLYVFFNSDGSCLYVGKNGSQNFVERIPWHFALAEGAYMNHLLKRIRTFLGIETLGEAALASQDYELLLIPVDDGSHDYIGRLENFLQLYLESRFNPASDQVRQRSRDVDLTMSMRELLDRF